MVDFMRLMSSNMGKGVKGVKQELPLDERFFRSCKVFSGDKAQFRSWMFDFLVAIGGADGLLQITLKRILSKDRGLDYNPESWSIADETMDDEEIWKKYRSSLYARLVALTDGQAKNILKEMAEKKGDQIDGFKALVIFC